MAIMHLTEQPGSDKDADRQAGAIPHEDSLPSLQELGITPEILEAAEEIADTSDVLGVERHTLELLLRRAFALHRQQKIHLDENDDKGLTLSQS